MIKKLYKINPKKYTSFQQRTKNGKDIVKWVFELDEQNSHPLYVPAWDVYSNKQGGFVIELEDNDYNKNDIAYLDNLNKPTPASNRKTQKRQPKQSKAN